MTQIAYIICDESSFSDRLDSFIVCVLWSIFQKCGTYFLMQLPYTLHWKSNIILYHNVNSPRFIFSLDNMNQMHMFLTFLTAIWHYMVVNFVYNGTPSWLPRFDKYASTFSITTLCLSEVWLLGWIWQRCLESSLNLPTTSDEICVISRTNNDRSSLICE